VYKSNLKKMHMFFQKKILLAKTSCIFYLLPGLLLLTVMTTSCKNSASDAEEKLEMDEVDRAMRQEFLMTRDPALNIVPTERLLTAMNFLNTARTTQINNLAWQERGPNN